MILGVDHLAISSDHVAESARRLSAAGYETSFIESALLNAEEKEPFLEQFHPRHAIALCRHPTGIAIELTDHHHLSANIGPYHLFSDQDLSLPTSSWADEGNPFSSNEMASNDSTVVTSAVATADTVAIRRGIRAVRIDVADLERSLRFWRDGLQCRLIERGTTGIASPWARLKFRALRPTWTLDVVLVECANIARPLPMLDDRGATCLALLTTDSKLDSARAGNASDGSIPQPFALGVAGKSLQIALVRGPDGEIVEFIQP